MDAIEKRARELLAEGVHSAWPDDHGRRLVIDALLVDGLDFISARVAVKVLVAALTPPEGYVLVPVEPTEAMLMAGGWVEPPDAHGQQYIEAQGAAQCWKLMMNARPEVP
ncbi:TPA: hypothetical protein QEK98_002973 [Stenotrophomonas maltophilia]|nr:hypothetical protein [Stenotrophomonas maltophilia]